MENEKSAEGDGMCVVCVDVRDVCGMKKSSGESA